MKTKNFITLGCMALALVSCEKKGKLETENSGASGKSTSQIKATTIVSYNKVSGTSVSSVNNYPGYVRQKFQVIGPLTVQANDVVTAHFQQQLNINSAKNAMASCHLIIASNPNVLQASDAGFIASITNPSGANCSVNEEVSYEE